MLLGAALSGCDVNEARGNGPASDLTAAVVTLQTKRPDSIAIRVFLDATVSMAGYVADGSSEYVKFLEELEASVQTGWPKVTVTYNKFGKVVREIDRAGFLQARSATFYQEKGMASTTAIDQVIDCDGENQVVVVITDLFQKEGDINAIVRQLKDRCLARGVAVGILGVRSQFDGTVYDARVPPYAYRSTGTDTSTYRPFYALMFGDATELERLVRSVASRPFVDTKYFSLIGNRVVHKYSVAMSKAPSARDLQNRKSPAPGLFVFDLKRDGTGGAIVADVTVDFEPSALPIAATTLRLISQPVTKSPAAGGSPGAVGSPSDISLKGKVGAKASTFRVDLDVSILGAKGARDYDLALETGAISGFEAPAWVAGFSSENPTPNSDANRTLNLERFVLDLRRAASSVSQPLIAKWRVRINKK